MEQPIDDIAETAVNALRSLIDDPQKPLPDYSFRPRLTVRASTAAPTRRLELHAEAALGDATADRRTDDDQADDHHHHRDRKSPAAGGRETGSRRVRWPSSAGVERVDEPARDADHVRYVGGDVMRSGRCEKRGRDPRVTAATSVPKRGDSNDDRYPGHHNAEPRRGATLRGRLYGLRDHRRPGESDGHRRRAADGAQSDANNCFATPPRSGSTRSRKGKPCLR